jgi:hypothetical protein
MERQTSEKNTVAVECAAYLCTREAEMYICNGKQYCIDHVKAILTGIADKRPYP